MNKVEALKSQFDDAHVDRVRIALRRDERRQQLVKAAMAQVELDLNAEFPEFQEAIEIETARRAEYDAARLEAAKARVNGNNYGMLIEWGMRDRDWYIVEKRYLLYKTGRRGILEVYETGTLLPETMGDWRKPQIGDVFLRLIKKNGEKSRKIITLHNGEIPGNWYPEGDKPAKAAAGE